MMAHEVETMFSARGQKPWHFSETGRTGQTVVVDHAPRALEAIKLAQLDWNVDLLPVRFNSEDGQLHTVADRFVMVRDRDNQSLAVVSDKYVPLQNHEAFQFLDNLVDDGLEFETAGSLRNGRTVFITAKLPSDILIGGTDAHELFLFVSNDHRGLHAVRIGITPIRIVCQNTLNLALGNMKRSWACAHVSTMQGRLQDAREALTMTWKYVEEFEEAAEGLASTSLNDAAFTAFLDECLAMKWIGPKLREDASAGITSLYNTSPTVGEFKGTAWGALNAVSEYFDWIRPSQSDEARLINVMEGKGLRVRDHAFALLS